MAGKGPSILVVAGDGGERRLIADLLREAGFVTVTSAEPGGAIAAMKREVFAALVVALAPGDAGGLLRDARRRQSAIKALIIAGPAEMSLGEDDCDTVIKRSYDPRQLLGCVFELVLRGTEREPLPRHSHAAELGIAAAEIACLHTRHATAAAAGALRLARDLTRQIGQTRAMHRRAAAAPIAGFAG